MLTFAILLTAFALSAVLTGLMRRYALAREILDVPNPRSSHQVPTPRGGGIAIVLVVTCGVAVLWAGFGLAAEIAAALAGGGALVALIGYLDDLGGLRPHWRLLAHLAAGAGTVALLGPLPSLSLPGTSLSLGWAGPVLAVVGIAWLINLYNFMDGIDGIAGVEAITVAGAAGGLLAWVNAPELSMFCLLIVGATGGFLVWNWPPARIFMGDSGSGFLGFILGVLMVAAFTTEALPLWSGVILAGAFIVDATYTLARRLLRGERIYEAHRSHAYQHAARSFAAHCPVTLATGAINLCWLCPLAALVLVWQDWGIVILVVAWAPLLWLCHHYRAGLPD